MKKTCFSQKKVLSLLRKQILLLTLGVMTSPDGTGVTFAPTPLSFPLNVSFDLLGFDLGTRDI